MVTSAGRADPSRMQLSRVDIRHELDEELRVVLWRTVTLSNAGYDDDSALSLALNSGVDLHVATSLLTRGCPPQTAVRILL
jgi:hypothetical protein